MSPQIPPKNWKELVPPIPGSTHQPSTLPRLPVPELQTFLERIKDSLRPFATSAEEYASVCKKIDDFKRSDGPGPILQRILLDRKNDKDNWLEEWWEDCAYFSCRKPLAIGNSPYSAFRPQPAHLPQTPAARAAGLTYSAMLMRQRLCSGKLAPEKNKGFELCMDLYRWTFDSCRVPGIEGTDWITSYSGSPSPCNDLGHVIVIRKNRFWKVKAQIGDTVAGMGDLISQFQHIYDHTLDGHPAIGALTTQDRDTWAKDYALLSSVARNADILREIQSSAFVMSLDDSTPPPESDVDVSKALWYGTLPSPMNPTGISRGFSSRYFDKPVQFIVFDNSAAGMVVEHSVIDGTHALRVCSEILEFLANPESDLRLSPSSSISTPEPLDFDLISIPGIDGAISRSQQFAHELASSKALSSVKTNYGRAAIKGFGVGPDGWAQMAIQVAYARFAERFGGKNGPVAPWPACTLEAASTRRFYKGRLGVIRAVSNESVAFVRAMLGDTATKLEKMQLLRDAVKKHQQSALASARGEDVDRHLFGLVYAQPPSMTTPELFDDPLIERSSDMMLFTSNLPSPHVRSFGWSELNDNGFGIAYLTGYDDHLQFTITSDCKMPNAEFANEIGNVLAELYEIFASSGHLSDPSVIGQGNNASINTKL